MQKVLGLDLGTNSIGWAVVERERTPIMTDGLRDYEEHFNLSDKGVLIFSEGVKIEKGNESSKAAERTEHRSARRIKFRRKLRKYETLKALIDYGMCPLTMPELKQWRHYTDPETGKQSNFKHYPDKPEFRAWLQQTKRATRHKESSRRATPYFLRAKALDSKLTPLELGRVFYHLAQRRGFLSNRLDSSDTSVLESVMPHLQRIIDDSEHLDELNSELESFYDSSDMDADDHKDVKKIQRAFYGIIKNNTTLSFEKLRAKLNERLNRKENLGAVKQGISELNEEINTSGMRTMGEYFYDLFKKGKKIRNRYTAREEHYLAEFEAICAAQNVDSELEEKLCATIFFQRPLKSQKGTVGKCSLEPSKARCPVSHPDFEEFRMLTLINNIKVIREGEEKMTVLTDEEREKVMVKFDRKAPSFPFEDLAKAIAPRGRYAYVKDPKAKDGDWLFNHQMKATIGGCPTRALLKGLFGAEIADISASYVTTNGKGEPVHRSVDAYDLWNILFSFSDIDKLYEYAIEKIGLDKKQARAFSAARLKQDYASLSRKAIANILPYLRQGALYSHAVFMAKLPEIIDRDKWEGNEAFLNEAISDLVENDREDNRRTAIANDLYSTHKQRYGDATADYTLDTEDKKEIEKKLSEVYGTKRLGEMDDINRSELTTDIKERYLANIKSRKHSPKKRLDEKIIDLIYDNDLCSDTARLTKLYHPSDIDTYPEAKRSPDGKRYLGSPMTSSVRNPMAMRSLHQLRKLVNTLIKEEVIDEDTHINIELSRELNDANKRKAIQTWQKSLETERQKAFEVIAELYKAECGKDVIPNEDDVLKYKLWTEQKRQCIYTGNTIGICDFIGPDSNYEIEHTLPRSISEDNSQMNVTLCEKRYNREVKRNRIPSELGSDHEGIMQRVEHFETQYHALREQMAAITKRVRAAGDKESKDALIEKRHLLRLEHDYLKGKHDRFEMKEVKSGFKNSQKVDIGLISKLSRAYLSSIFPRVYSVKGSMVAEFRKVWGLQDIQKDENGQPEYDSYGMPVFKPKDRSNHAHHCQDAVVIACMSKSRYDILAKAWRLQEKQAIEQAKEVLNKSIPWPTFSKDVRDLPKEILVVHHTPDKVGKAAKKKWKKRGRVQRNDKGDLIYLKGDSARGSLHKDTFYGAILRPEKDKKTGDILLDTEGAEKHKLHYVTRKPLDSLDDSNIKHIVDERIRSIVENGRARQKQLEKEVKALKAQIKTAEEAEEAAIKKEITALNSIMANELYVLPNGNGTPVPIKKVRCYQPTVKTPLHIKKHTHQSRHEHKSHYHVMNDENYCFAIYEGQDKKGNTKRLFEVMNMLDSTPIPTIPKEKEGLYLRDILKKGDAVLFYEEHPDELKGIPNRILNTRLYQLAKSDTSGRLTFRPHTEARAAGELKEVSKLTLDALTEQVVLTRNNWQFISEGEGFVLTASGKIQFTF